MLSKHRCILKYEANVPWCQSFGDQVSTIKRRQYRMEQRAAKAAETHSAISRAAFELHSTVGPARTTVSSIAAKAGVQRLTVYRHFADERAIFEACTAYSFAHDPPPNPETWRSVSKPRFRLGHALAELYGYYERKHKLLENLYRDRDLDEVAAALARRHATLAKGVKILLEIWPRHGKKRERMLAATIGHAMAFSTWQSLIQSQRLSKKEAIALMLRLIE